MRPSHSYNSLVVIEDDIHIWVFWVWEGCGRILDFQGLFLYIVFRYIINFLSVNNNLRLIATI